MSILRVCTCIARMAEFDQKCARSRSLLLQLVDNTNQTIVHTVLCYTYISTLNLFHGTTLTRSGAIVKFGTGETVLTGEHAGWGNRKDVSRIRSQSHNGVESAIRGVFRSILKLPWAYVDPYQSSRYNEYRSLWGSFRLLLATNGVKGLFQGATATAARDAPYAGMSLVFYEKGKDSLCEWSSWCSDVPY